MAKYTKREHGKVNPIFLQEEIALIALADKAQNSTTNSKILGENGEIGIKDFLNRYLPSCFRAVGGHFVTPDGELSPEIDIMLVDSRYPYLSQNENGSVVAMMHSVLSTIEVKLSLNSSEINKIRNASTLIEEFSDKAFPGKDNWSGIIEYAIAYRSDTLLKTVDKTFFKDYKERPPYTDLYILRLHPSDIPKEEQHVGASVWLEASEYPEISLTVAPLSDFYYRLLQNAYYILGDRDISFNDLGQQMMAYMAWGTFSSLKFR